MDRGKGGWEGGEEDWGWVYFPVHPSSSPPPTTLTGRGRETLVASFGIPHESRRNTLAARTRGKSDTCLMQRSCFLLGSRPAEKWG